MAILLVKLRVADFNTWKKVFDSMDPVCREHGITTSTVHRDAADPNVVVVINHAETVGGATRHAGSLALREAMARAGVQGVPEINVLEEVA